MAIYKARNRPNSGWTEISIENIRKGKKIMKLKFRFIMTGLTWLGIAVSGGEPVPVSEPEFDEVKKAAGILLNSDCMKESLRDSEAQKILQAALDRITPEEYVRFCQRGVDISTEELIKIYREHPAFYWYDTAFEKVLNEVRSESVVPGEVKLWLVYNMGYIVKSPTHCFCIDLHHRRAKELVPYLEFALVTHNHGDHYTRDFLTAMNEQGKKVYSAFFPSYGGYSKEPERVLRLADDLTIHVFESDHNRFLLRFVTPFEIVCKTGSEECVIFHSGDSCNAQQLHPKSAKVDFHIVHPRVGLDVRESARDTVKPDVTLISHLLEFHHKFDRFRWSFTVGYEEAEKVRSVGRTAYVPMWGEKIVWRKESGAK